MLSFIEKKSREARMSMRAECRPPRCGLLIPSSNTMIEQEYGRLLPQAVSAHYQRLPMTTLDDAGIREQDAAMEGAAGLLGDARVGVLLLCQTAASFHMGAEWDAAVKRRLSAAAGCPAITAAGTVVAALRTLGVARIGLGTPFPAEMNAASAAYLEARGIEVANSAGLGYRDNFGIALMKPAQVLELAARANAPDAEAVLLPGGNMPCLPALAAAEQALGKPVLSTNQCGAWAMLSVLGRAAPMKGAGVLLARHFGKFDVAMAG